VGEAEALFDAPGYVVPHPSDIVLHLAGVRRNDTGLVGEGTQRGVSADQCDEVRRSGLSHIHGGSVAIGYVCGDMQFAIARAVAGC
jgi:hypothetical protein